MPTKKAKKPAAVRAKADKAAGKSPGTQAGEFVGDEVAAATKAKRPRKQAIAIGLSKARRAGVDVPPPKRSASAATKKKADRDKAAGRKSAT